MNDCPCGSKISYSSCCGLYHSAKAIAPTPEALMRSRYTAYTQANFDYIKATMRGKLLKNTTPIARNAPCPCGSPRKFKNCHG